MTLCEYPFCIAVKHYQVAKKKQHEYKKQHLRNNTDPGKEEAQYKQYRAAAKPRKEQVGKKQVFIIAVEEFFH